MTDAIPDNVQRKQSDKMDPGYPCLSRKEGGDSPILSNSPNGSSAAGIVAVISFVMKSNVMFSATYILLVQHS